MPTPIPLTCDRCRVEGAAGEDPFAQYAELLDFEPVPRRPRADGWDAEVQRAFIAMLAATGSPRQAAAAVGKAQFGVEQLRKAKGNESFMAAFDRAMAFFAENRSQRLAEGVRAATAAIPRPPRPAWGHAATRQRALPAPPANDEQDTEAARLEVLEALVRQYLLKLAAERRVRLEGKIAEADFYVRQLTLLEVAMDLMSYDGMALLHDLRHGGHELVNIAATPMSELLDEARRAHWEACGDPPRPGPPPIDLLVRHESGIVTEPLPFTRGGIEESHEEQRRKQEEQFARDAADHVEWEARARQDFEDRREAARPQSRETDRAGQPAT